MKSICIKLASKKATEYLLKHLNEFQLENVYFSYKKFKFYHNVIVHYKGKNIDLFIKTLSQTLSLIIINLY